MELGQSVLEFWFGASPATQASVAARSPNWFGGGPKFDETISARFGADIDHALSGDAALDVNDPCQALALVILLDQFPRNVFRRTRMAFAGDERSLRVTHAVIENGRDADLGAVECGFLFMPLQHVESLEEQEQGVARFAGLAARAAPWEQSLVKGFHKYAVLHRDIIREFGRFPHRNAILGRDNTEAEQAYLDGEGRRFGQ